MKKQNYYFKIILFLIFIFSTTLSQAQIKVEGYTFETGNRGYLSQVTIVAYDANGIKISSTYSDIDGKFVLTFPNEGIYIINASKELFHNNEMEFICKSTGSFLNLEMKRAPGYIFEMTLAEKRDDIEMPVDNISDALIEVYNNTTKKEVLILKDHSQPDFSINMAKGNHYTVLIRKKGYLSRQMEAFVDVQGCILCLEGFGTIQPNVTDNLTEGNQMGSLLANIEMEPVFHGKKIELENIYFDLAKWNIRPDAAEELQDVAAFLELNPRLTVELGSHTDSRGSSSSNMTLSQKRAESTVNWLVRNGGIQKHRITWKGYGDTHITNRCVKGVECSDEEHQENRRSELKITGFMVFDGFKPLGEIKRLEQQDELILELQNQQSIKVTGEVQDEEKLEDLLDEANQTHSTKVVTGTAIVVEETKTVVDPNGAIVDDIQVAKVTTTVFEDEKGNINEAEIDIEQVAEIIEVQVPNNYGLKRVFNNEPITNYNGYSCVIKSSDHELESNDPIFQTHGNTLMQYTMDNGFILYLVGEFDNFALAEEFLNNTILLLYKDANLVRFEKSVKVN